MVGGSRRPNCGGKSLSGQVWHSRRDSVFVLQALIDFFAQLVEDVACGSGDSYVLDLARPWQGNGKLVLDATWTKGK